MVTASIPFKSFIKKQEELNSALVYEYERVINEKDSLIQEQNEIIEKQKEYIYNLLNEIDRKPLLSSLKLNCIKLFSFIF